MMNNDGWGQVGAGQDDRRMEGDDLQHYKQRLTADENPRGKTRMVMESYQSGGPMKEMLDQELNRHRESREMRASHLKAHYER